MGPQAIAELPAALTLPVLLAVYCTPHNLTPSHRKLVNQAIDPMKARLLVLVDGPCGSELHLRCWRRG